MNETYTDIISTINELFKEFTYKAWAGKEGPQSKHDALTARKISTELEITLKRFRKLSVINDKAKIKQIN